jgi:hypothetical protein
MGASLTAGAGGPDRGGEREVRQVCTRTASARAPGRRVPEGSAGRRRFGAAAQPPSPSDDDVVRTCPPAVTDSDPTSRCPQLPCPPWRRRSRCPPPSSAVTHSPAASDCGPATLAAPGHSESHGRPARDGRPGPGDAVRRSGPLRPARPPVTVVEPSPCRVPRVPSLIENLRSTDPEAVRDVPHRARSGARCPASRPKRCEMSRIAHPSPACRPACALPHSPARRPGRDRHRRSGARARLLGLSLSVPQAVGA